MAGSEMTVNITLTPMDVEHVDLNERDLEWESRVYILMNETQALGLVKEIVTQLFVNSHEKEE